MTDITEMLVLIIQMVTLVFILIILPKFNSKLKEDDVLIWVNIAVNAVEQLSKLGKVQDKKKEAKLFLEKNGITYDEDKIDMMIESEVNKMNQHLREYCNEK